ncbi:MAG: virulence RhuM family protein [Hyphomonadaceae bacterium]|nr:virulence RhuM family protein [Hyphomonadaceae bacterium]
MAKKKSSNDTPETALERLSAAALEAPVRLVQREGDPSPPILFYATDKGPKLEVRVKDGDLWVTQAQMSSLFGVDVRTVNDHVQKYLQDGEIDDSVIRKFRITASDKKTYETNHYAIDVAFYVGYRVNSRQGALFRKAATDILVRFAKYGFAIDVERLKAPAAPSIADEFKDIIREIRASTQNAYREVKKMVSLCQDYDGSNETARDFYARMENKLLYVATNHTAPEIIIARADATSPQMGLTYYLGKRGPTQADATVANNYLSEPEARVKNRATVMLLDYFEEQLDQGRLVTMQEAEEKLDGFIKFNNWPLLRDAGRVTRAAADRRAIEQQKLYNKRQSE